MATTGKVTSFNRNKRVVRFLTGNHIRPFSLRGEYDRTFYGLMIEHHREGLDRIDQHMPRRRSTSVIHNRQLCPGRS